MMSKFVLGAVLLSCCAAMPAMAQVRLVDQSNGAATPTPNQPMMTSVSYPIVQNSPLGQSFMPTLTGLNFASFRITNQFSPSPVSLITSLYAGVGRYTSSNLLATSQVITLAGSAAFSDVEFRFDNIVPLIPNSVYSLILNDLTFTQTGVRDDASVAQGSVYSRGAFILQGTALTTDSNGNEIPDLIFSEGLLLPTPAVPEPTTWAMMILGSGVVGGALRRRRKVTTRVSFA